MYTPYLTAKRDGSLVWFMARDWGEARRLAAQVAGKRYRFVQIIPPGHCMYREAMRALQPN